MFEGRSAKVFLYLELEGLGKVDANLSLKASTKTSRSSSFMKPMCMSMEVEDPSFTRDELS